MAKTESITAAVIAYALGEPVLITITDFAEIALACQMFADDLATKLPILPPNADQAMPPAQAG